MRFYTVIFTAFLLGCALSATGQTPRKTTREEYILKYKALSVRQMNITGIPASIIMAQACLESDNGNSRLAVEANNHFGIKCHKPWDGDKIYHDDDKKQECFRKYDTSEGSFFDHSEFLRNRDRYAALFSLPASDYKGWAHGLKKAGYATNPVYAELLIKIIEDNKLYELDTEPVNEQLLARLELEQKQNIIEIDSYIFEVHRRQRLRNKVKYVLARDRESYKDIAIELGINLKKLEQYNDTNDHVLSYGEMVYIEKKKRSTAKDQPVHVAGRNETMHSISQRYAVRLDKLYEYNGMKKGQEPMPGDEVFLRKNKRRR
ncbi:MAG: glucosaminidase domain-containing protein [Prevotellaceae bacterium]|nr:glucosaminidase domain-containing protein [Prevotellaceae bacterium]